MHESGVAVRPVVRAGAGSEQCSVVDAARVQGLPVRPSSGDDFLAVHAATMARTPKGLLVA